MQNEWYTDPDTGNLVHKPSGRKIEKQKLDDIETFRKRGEGVPTDLDELRRIVASDPGPIKPAGLTLKYEITIVDGATIEYRRIEANTHWNPKLLKAGEREPDTLQTYEMLRALAQHTPKEREFQIPKLIHIQLREFGKNPNVIEAGEVPLNSVNQWTEIRPGGFMTPGGFTFEELQRLGPGRHYLARHW